MWVREVWAYVQQAGLVAELIPLANGRVRLQAIQGSDYDFLYRLAFEPESLLRWRYRGATPSPEEFRQTLWLQVLAQFSVVTDRGQGGEYIGLVTAYNANHRNQTCYISLLSAPWARGHGLAMSGLELFISYLFRNWPFRKLLFETFDFNLRQFDSGLGTLFEEEGRIREYEYFDGKFWDLIIGSVTREDWDVEAGRSRRLQVATASAIQMLPDTKALTEANFCSMMQRLLGGGATTHPGAFTLDTRLEDIHIDSLQVLELIDILEEVSNARIPDTMDITRWKSIRDIYLLYLELCQSPADADSGRSC